LPSATGTTDTVNDHGLVASHHRFILSLKRNEKIGRESADRRRLNPPKLHPNSALL
jgi:hypothetical protein